MPSNSFSTYNTLHVSQLTDTNISNPANGEVLAYQASSGLWVNQTSGGLPSYTTAQRDALTPYEGQVIYNSTKGNIELILELVCLVGKNLMLNGHKIIKKLKP